MRIGFREKRCARDTRLWSVARPVRAIREDLPANNELGLYMRIDAKISALCAVIRGAQKQGAHRSLATPPRYEVSTALR